MRRLDLKTSNKTSLGTVPKAETTRARFVFFVNASAPDDVCAIARAVSLEFIGIEQVMSTFPERSPACFNTSLTRDQ